MISPHSLQILCLVHILSQMLAFWFFGTGLTAKATALLAFQLMMTKGPSPFPPLPPSPPAEEMIHGSVAIPDGPSFSVGYTCLAIAVLVVIVSVLCTGLAMLLNFFFRFCAKSWVPSAPATDWKDVDDPAFRLYSRLKVSVRRICGLELKPTPRAQGKWTKLPEDTKEPARTERLLARPYALLREHGADCLESMSLSLLTKVSGGSFLGLAFAWISMLIQVTIGVLSGIGPYLDRGSMSALSQILSIALLKLAWVMILIFYTPCACLLSNFIVCCQFLSEGISILLLFLGDSQLAPASLLKHSFSLQSNAFVLTLLAVLFPVIQKGALSEHIRFK